MFYMGVCQFQGWNLQEESLLSIGLPRIFFYVGVSVLYIGEIVLPQGLVNSSSIQIGPEL